MPHCALPGATRASTSGSNVSEWMPTASTPARRDLVEHAQVVGRLELDLDRQPAGLLDRGRAAADVERAAVAPVERAGGQRDVDGVVEVARRGAHLGELRRRLDRDRLLAARELDPAERRTARACPSRCTSARRSRRSSRGAAARSSSTGRRRRSPCRRSAAAAAASPARPARRRGTASRAAPRRAACTATRRRSRRATGTVSGSPRTHRNSASDGPAPPRRAGQRVRSDSSTTRTPSDCSSTSSWRSSSSSLRIGSPKASS